MIQSSKSSMVKSIGKAGGDVKLLLDCEKLLREYEIDENDEILETNEVL
jgi:chemotaxis signal transduction protein